MKLSLLLIFAFSISSCAYRAKGMRASSASSEKSVALAPDAEIILPKEWSPNYPKTSFKIFSEDPSAEWLIKRIEYKQAAPDFMCGTGFFLPLVVSFATFGIIPVQLTDEWEGFLTVKNQKTGQEKRVFFHGKLTSSFSLWNKFKIGRDKEWSNDWTSREIYLRNYLSSKIVD